MRAITLIASMVILSVAASAQDSVKVTRYDYMFAFYGGPQKLGIAGVNNLLESRGITPLPSSSFLWGFSNTAFRTRFGFGSGLEFYSTRADARNTDRWAQINGFNFNFHFAYYIIERQKFTLFPYAGLRVAYSNLRTGQFTSPTSADQLLTQPQYSASIIYINNILDVGIGGQLRTNLKSREWDCPQADRYLLLDFRVGWNVMLSKDHGQSGGNRFREGPTIEYKGPYFRVGIGFGTKFRRMNWR